MADAALIVDEYVDAQDLENFRKAYDEQSRRGTPSAICTFNYAHALCRSTKENVKTGIFLMNNLLRRGSEDIPRRDCVYFLAVAYARLKEYDRALEHVDLLLGAESDNRQAIALKQLINDRMKRESLIGMAFLGIGGGVAVIASLVAAGILARRH